MDSAADNHAPLCLKTLAPWRLELGAMDAGATAAGTDCHECTGCVRVSQASQWDSTKGQVALGGARTLRSKEPSMMVRGSKSCSGYGICGLVPLSLATWTIWGRQKCSAHFSGLCPWGSSLFFMVPSEQTLVSLGGCRLPSGLS